MSREWTVLEVDKMLDLFLAGMGPKALAERLNRNPANVRSCLSRFLFDTDGAVSNYRTVKRTSRRGFKWTKNELLLRKAHFKHKIALNRTAGLLNRDLKELDGHEIRDSIQTNIQKQTAPTLDLIWAHHYLHSIGKSFLPDTAYDDLVKEEIEFGGGETAFVRVKASLLKSYPGRIRSLANYLLLTYKGIE